MSDDRLKNEIEHGKVLRKSWSGTLWYWETPAGKLRFKRRLEMITSHIEPGMKVLELGCGVGYFTKHLAETKAAITANDISPDLLEVAREQVKAENVTFKVENAYDLSYADNSFDTVVGSSVLHHLEVDDALRECYRVLKPGGILCVTTTNKLCPVQHEFKLPLYSWYPAPIKRYYERIATSKRPELVNHAKFPAVNWFSYFSLRKALRALGFETLDRFDVNNTQNRKGLPRYVLLAIQNIPFLRWLAHVFVQGTLVVAIKGKTHHVQKID